MEISQTRKLQKNYRRHTAEVSGQTGFPSAATHYAEQPIDLHDALVTNRDATFFIRVKGNDLENIQIYDDDVLIVDRSLSPRSNQLAVVVQEGAFLVRELQLDTLESDCELWGVITYIIHKV